MHVIDLTNLEATHCIVMQETALAPEVRKTLDILFIEQSREGKTRHLKIVGSQTASRTF